jgi:hypothetical protein
MHGRYCQERTALLVAAYMKALAVIYDHKPESLDAALRSFLPLAQSIQDSVQGIKKYVGLSLEVNEAYELCEVVLANLLGEDLRSSTASVIRGKLIGYKSICGEYLDALHEVYGVSIEKARISGADGSFKSSNLDAVILTADEKAILHEAWVLVHQPKVNPHLGLVDHLLAKVLGVSRAHLADNPDSIDALDASKLERIIILYGAFVNALVKKGGVSKVRSMNGMACLYAERALTK